MIPGFSASSGEIGVRSAVVHVTSPEPDLVKFRGCWPLVAQLAEEEELIPMRYKPQP